VTQPSSLITSTNLVEKALSGDRRALAKLLTLVEDGDAEGRAAMAKLFSHTGQAHIVGVTGSPGSGKSTLLNCITRTLRQDELKVAIVAVDPTSPFSGGALLGDRLRMRDLVTDSGVFIRSMASRGHPGGVAHATRGVVSVLDAVGFPVILVETVGAGQGQVEVARVAHTVVLVEAPGMGDDIQALKAGMMEIADIIVVNKADRPEAARTVQAIKSVHMLQTIPNAENTHNSMLDFMDTRTGWTVPILQTSAIDGQGISQLMDVIAAHKKYLVESGKWQLLREHHIRAEIETWFRRHFETWLQQELDVQTLDTVVETVLLGKQDPATAAQVLLMQVLGESRKYL
jgi:LAO/AO transport system kinase